MAAFVAAGLGGCRLTAPEDQASIDQLVEQVTYDAPASVAELPIPTAYDGAPPDVMAATAGGPPLRLAGLRSLEELPADQRAPLGLEELVAWTAENAGVLRDPNQFFSPNNTLFAAPEQTATSLDAAIFAAGGRGRESAQAALDTQFATGMRRDQDSLTSVSNVLTGAIPTSAVTTDTGGAYMRLDRPNSYGGTVSLIHNWDYTPGAVPGRVFQSDYFGFLRAEVRQPLLAGRGGKVTRAAGPAALNRGAMGQGVEVAEMEERIAELDFERRLQLLTKQARDAYWEHWAAFETVRRHADALELAESLAKNIAARADSGLPGGEAAAVAQAEEAVLTRESDLNDAWAALLATEDRLRRLAGLPPGDGRLLIPEDTPFDGAVDVSWNESVARAKDARIELAQQRLRVEASRARMHAAENLAQPTLDVIAAAQSNGFGSDIFGGGYGSMLDGENLGWNLGAEYSSSLSRRGRRTRLRHAQLELQKLQRLLASQEEELGHEIAHCFTEIGRAHEALKIAAKRRTAAGRRAGASLADYRAGRATLDSVVRAQSALLQAEQNGIRRLVDYNRAINELRYREGRLDLDPPVPPRPTLAAAGAPAESPETLPGDARIAQNAE